VSLPVLAFGAGVDGRHNDSWRGPGFAAYVAKSVSPDELAAALLEVARAISLHDEPYD
jgi:hypothetical protein